MISEEECEEAEDVEVPKALGDVFESVAGAVFLDSKMSLDAVWKVYYRMMKTEIGQYTFNTLYISLNFFILLISVLYVVVSHFFNIITFDVSTNIK